MPEIINPSHLTISELQGFDRNIVDSRILYQLLPINSITAFEFGKFAIKPTLLFHPFMWFVLQKHNTELVRIIFLFYIPVVGILKGIVKMHVVTRFRIKIMTGETSMKNRRVHWETSWSTSSYIYFHYNDQNYKLTGHSVAYSGKKGKGKEKERKHCALNTHPQVKG